MTITSFEDMYKGLHLLSGITRKQLGKIILLLCENSKDNYESPYKKNW